MDSSGRRWPVCTLEWGRLTHLWVAVWSPQAPGEPTGSSATVCTARSAHRPIPTGERRELLCPPDKSYLLYCKQQVHQGSRAPVSMGANPRNEGWSAFSFLPSAARSAPAHTVHLSAFPPLSSVMSPSPSHLTSLLCGASARSRLLEQLVLRVCEAVQNGRCAWAAGGKAWNTCGGVEERPRAGHGPRHGKGLAQHTCSLRNHSWPCVRA